MKPKQIKFFSLEDNLEEKKKSVKEEVAVAKAYITANGKLVLPLATLQQLGISTDGTRFKVGVEANKRSFKGLYLIPEQSIQAPSFELTKIGKGYSLQLKGIFQKLELDYKNLDYQFEIKPVEIPGEIGFFAKLFVAGNRSHG
jgi:hypothetical protein